MRNTMKNKNAKKSINNKIYQREERICELEDRLSEYIWEVEKNE